MTGYGSASSSVGGWRVQFECWSVNRDRLDVRPRVPEGFTWVKPKIKSAVKKRIDRGRVEVTLDIDFEGESEGASEEFIDHDRFQQVCRTLRQLAETTATEPVELGDILTFRDEFELDKIEAFSGDENDVLPVLEQALDQLVQSRRQEGQNLAEEIHELLDELDTALDRLEAVWPEVEQAYKESLIERVQESIEAFEIGDIDENRLGEELAYYAEKRDISEEVQRLESHLSKLRKTLDGEGDSDDGRKGKTIDFYLQEMVRETNTMSSKVDGAELTDIVIEAKSIVEKLREQAANIE
jgi:uncharacterized protein (TIGR00255 family)